MSERSPRRPPVVVPSVRARARRERFPAPKEFRPSTDTPPGRYRLLDIFQGLERTVPFGKYPGEDGQILRIAKNTWAEVAEGPGWMYVAPRKTPPEVRSAGFRMVETEDDVIVVAQGHLRNSPSMDVYLDIIHEFLHILQRKQGRELWPGPKFPYVDRPTEVEAYAFSVVEARRLGVPDGYLRTYLEVPWVRRSEYRRLLRHLGVAERSRRRSR